LGPVSEFAGLEQLSFLRVGSRRASLFCGGKHKFKTETEKNQNGMAFIPRYTTTLGGLEDPLQEMFSDLMVNPFGAGREWSTVTAPRTGGGQLAWIRSDLVEKPDSYFLSCDLPGVKKEDVDVTVDGAFVYRVEI
jgi:HSP20 family molecular chaperone IbpA